MSRLAELADFYRVPVSELLPDGSGVLEARYEVTALAPRGGHVIRDVELRQASTGSDVAASVAALSESLAELARRIAADIRSL